MSTIGMRIKWKRLAAGLNAEQLGKLIGKNRATIYRYESDAVDIPIAVVDKLAKALHTTPAYLMGWKKPQTVSDDDIKFALFGGDNDITDEDFEEVKRFSEFLKEKNKGKRKN